MANQQAGIAGMAPAAQSGNSEVVRNEPTLLDSVTAVAIACAIVSVPFWAFFAFVAK